MVILSKRAEVVQESATLAIGAQAKALKAAGKHVIDFSLGEPDFPTPRHVKDAALSAIKNNFTYYTAAGGIPELKTAVCTKFQRDNTLVYVPEQVLISHGAKHSIMNIFFALLNKGDEVIVPVPYWTSYPEMIKLADGVPVFCDTDAQFHLTAALLEKKITKKTKLVIIGSPSNPTGAVIPKDELEKIAVLCVKKNIFVLSDEVYEHFCYDKNPHLSIASFSKEMYDLTCTVNSVSKTYSMTGWRIGYLAGPKVLVKKMDALQSQMTSCPNSIAQKAAVAALTGDQHCVQEMLHAFAERRAYIHKRLNAVKGLTLLPPEGAFYAFVKFDFPLSSQDFCVKLLNDALVGTVPGSAFGAEGYFRISYATSMDVIKQGCDRIEKFSSTI
jgi:aspartate aminotransferase